MICENCGANLNPDDKFCLYCGMSVKSMNNKKSIADTQIINKIKQDSNTSVNDDTFRLNNEYTKNDVYSESGQKVYSNSLVNKTKDNIYHSGSNEKEIYQKPSPSSNYKKRETNQYHNNSAYNTKTSVVKKSSQLSKPKIAAIVISVVIVIAGIIAASIAGYNYSVTKEMSAALNSNNASRVNAVYQEALSSNSKIKKYDSLISDKLIEIKDDFNSHNFDEEGEAEGGQAVYNYLENQWGTLIYSEDGETMSPSVSASNRVIWDEITDLYSSKVFYCQAVYEYVSQKNYSAAIEQFSNVSEDDSLFENAKTMLSECVDSYISSTLSSVDESMSSGDISSGLETLNSAKAYLDECGVNSDEIQKKIDETLVSYAQSYVQKADSSFKEHDINGAIGNIEVAMELQPNNGDYRNTYDTYVQYLPYELYLEENVLYEDESGDVYGSAEYDITMDSNNNKTLTHCIRWYDNKDTNESSWNVYYNLEGKYDTVSGTIFLEDFYKDYKSPGYFEVYGDGKLLYTSPEVQAGVLPQEFDFSVSEIQKLKISFHGCEGANYGVSNLVAQKDFPN